MVITLKYRKTGYGESIENLVAFQYNDSRKILRAERGGLIMRKGYPLDMGSGLSLTGDNALGCLFCVDKASI